MISHKSLHLEWINEISKRYRKADKILAEKVIMALILLEKLANSDLDFIFKGGTSLMLMQKEPKRFSIDIDIIIPQNTTFDSIFDKFLSKKGFFKYELQERKTESLIQKYHYKFFYTSTINTNRDDNILLDILVENIEYENIKELEVNSPFVIIENKPSKVKVPSADDLLADKLTAFAPNTTGIPYEKGGKSRSMEIIKQLYDIGNLFEDIENIQAVRKVFNKMAAIEMKNRGIKEDIGKIHGDIQETALCLSTKGQSGGCYYDELVKGVSRVSNYIFSEKYNIDKAIVDAAKAAYCSKLIETANSKPLKFNNPEQILNSEIKAPFNTKLNKLKKTNPEAFYYWYQIYILENG